MWIKHLIIDFKPITPRICTLRTRGKFFNYSFINARFFNALETAYDTSPRNYIKIVLSDFNALVAKEPVDFPTMAITVFTVSWTTMDPG